jgi:hypothetical protein
VLDVALALPRRALRAVAIVGACNLDAELELAGTLDPAGAVDCSPIAAAAALATSTPARRGGRRSVLAGDVAQRRHVMGG